MNPRPLVCRRADGRRYTVPGTPPALPTPRTPAPASERGSRAGRTPKLTDDDVRQIRADYAAGRWSQADLAYIHGVNAATISSVVHGLTYTHVKPAPDQQES